jgi:hypothetical protein
MFDGMATLPQLDIVARQLWMRPAFRWLLFATLASIFAARAPIF